MSGTWPSGDNLETFQKGIKFSGGHEFTTRNGIPEFNGENLLAKSSDIYYQENFAATKVEDCTLGNGIPFDAGAAAINGTALDEEVAPISGVRSLKYIQAAGSLNDFIFLPTKNISRKQSGSWSGLVGTITSTTHEDMRAIVWDITNGAPLTSSLDLVPLKNKPCRFIIGNGFFIPDTCTEIAVGFQVVNETVGAVFEVDDVDLSTNPFTYTTDKTKKFSATINNNGTPAIAHQTETFLNPADLSLVGIGNVEINFASLGLVNPPAVIISGDGISSDGIIYYQNLTNTTVRIRSFDNNVAKNFNFSIDIIPLGEDYTKFNGYVTPVTPSFNGYSAKINSNATVATVNAENWLEDANVTISGNDYIIDWSHLGLVNAPTVQVTPNASTVGVTASHSNITSAGCIINIYNSSLVPILSESFSLQINLQGEDVKDARLLAALPSDYFQTKTLPVNINTSQTISSLTFNNLVLDKTYELFIQAVWDSETSAGSASVTAIHNGVDRSVASINPSSANSASGGSKLSYAKFTAEDTSITISYSGTRNLLGDGTESKTKVTIKECNNEKVTDRF